MTEPGHLKPKTAAIIFAVVAIAFIVACVSAGAWPLAVGALLVIVLMPLLTVLLNEIGSAFLLLLGSVVTRVLPQRFRVFASERDLPTSAVVLIFAVFVGILLLIFRSVIGVIAGLSVAGVLVGLPLLAEWSRQRKLRKAANNTSELTSGGRADASPRGSST